jgi:hypothetical protein
LNDQGESGLLALAPFFISAKKGGEQNEEGKNQEVVQGLSGKYS